MVRANPPYYQSTRTRTHRQPPIPFWLCCLFMCCFPCCLGGAAIRKQFRKRWPKVYKPKKVKVEAGTAIVRLGTGPSGQTAVRPLGKRERRLTLRSDEDWKGDVSGICSDGKEDALPLGTTHDQLQSRLFKLPLELREQIWENVLGGHLFHIHHVQAYKRFSHRVRSILSLFCSMSRNCVPLRFTGIEQIGNIGLT